ncbi:CDP-alcohol phosphatidyltransferase family protein [Altererythrobacter sp. GH1-8]|uniref:CDP-alcohol phosphatidyltransferase family protein n=1 Tax=Altererythrobacter sp. GH1-8 TaxID=3349333 RepID=UPI00374DEA07
MPESPPSTILFASERAANQLVAGVPAAARAIATLSQHGAGSSSVTVAVPGGWKPSSYCLAEAERLSPAVEWQALDAAKVEIASVISGDALQTQELPPKTHPGNTRGYQYEGACPKEAQQLGALCTMSRAIISATGKAGDGIVSRYINRPISQALTGLALKSPHARPGHATALAALLGLAMVAALVWGGTPGLVIGAVLFQLASIIDGVDGEMARATQRSSETGAMLDSLTDAATNLGFLAGVSFNVWQQGMTKAASAGALGFIVLALGSVILGLQARRAGGPFTFDALKHKMRAKPSRIKQALIYITMRDFYALAACLAILAGAVVPILWIFATVACGWFLVVCFTAVSSLLARNPRSH